MSIINLVAPTRPARNTLIVQSEEYISKVKKNSTMRVPASAQKFLLSVYRMAVDFYQPKIEARTGVQLGVIEVREHSKLRHQVIENYKKRYGLIRSLLYWRKIRSHCRTIEKWGEEYSSKTFACYYKNAIYVSFSSSADHEDWIAEVVVHELAHALWEKLGGLSHEQRSSLSSEERDQYKLLSEGYATYAQNVWFRDIYPLDVRVDVGYSTGDSEGVYSRGFKRIRQLVSEHGSAILMEIPRRWREFSNTGES